MLAACRPPPTAGARPHEMSVAGHEAAAHAEDRRAMEHVAKYDPDAKVQRLQCSSTMPHPQICWTVIVNPTEWQLRAAEDHRRRAADHRAGSAALRDAEARACVGIADADRDISPFARVEDIAGVEPLRASNGGPVVGALVTFRARPGLTADRLQRVVDCHSARSAVLGHTMAGMPDCPLAPAGLTARVTSTANGLVVAIRAGTPSVGRDVLERARRSAQRPPTPSRKTPANLRWPLICWASTCWTNEPASSETASREK